MLQDYISFLNQLSHNNTKLWFDAHKDEYVKLQKEYEVFIDEMIVEIHKIDNNIQFLTRREAAFRIYRDARFSKDKTPYKTWISAAFSPNGKKADEPAYFFRLDGQGLLTVGGGLWTPEPDKLMIVRKNISKDSKALNLVINDKKLTKVFGMIQDHQVSRPPRGFAKDDPSIELLKQKSLIFMKTVNFSGDYKDLKTDLKVYFQTLHPLIEVMRDYLIERYE